MHFINENELDNWVRGNAELAQGLIVELVAKLVTAASPKPRDRRFPLGDSIGQHGPDGYLDAIISNLPFVPEGKSFWEIGTSADANKKATGDYRDLTNTIPLDIRLESTFIFVTPISGRKGWKHTPKKDGQITWLEERKKKGEWKDVRIIDGSKLIEWIHQFIAIELWLARKTRSLNENQIETIDQSWELLRSIGEPPPLSAELFLANRVDACAKLKELMMSDGTFNLKLTTHFPTEAIHFVSALVSSLDEETRRDITSKCVIVSGVDAWNNICTRDENLILIADPKLDLNSDLGIQLLQRARKANHSVIYSGPKGGLPDPGSILLPSPRGYHIEEELKKASYSDERARVLAQQCDGSLTTLLRFILNLSSTPEWAQRTPGGDFAISAMIGSWNENSAADKTAVEAVAGKTYGEWISLVRSAASKPSTPLIFRDGKWKFISRYQGWYALGDRISDDYLDRFQKIALEVLSQKDPKFEMDKDERYAAQIYGKALPHSTSLRNGLADTIALLGSHPGALTGCSTSKPEVVANSIVRSVLKDADWQLWATLNDILPLLAEASPKEFLNAIEIELTKNPSAFDQLFKEEGNGITGGNYTTGILWGLETLAWDPNFLLPVTLCLGFMAARDPGGQWANRPANSLRHIFLSWLPQTIAPTDKRFAAVKALLKEAPEVGWKLLLDLLPDTHSSSSHSRKPAWRSSIPDDWKQGVSNREYWTQIKAYAEMAVDAAKGKSPRIVQLIEHIEGLPRPLHEAFLEYLSSEEFLNAKGEGRIDVWNALMRIVGKHRKFSDAKWAFPDEIVDKIASVADAMKPTAPSDLYTRLFSNHSFDLFETKGNYNEQMQFIEQKRRAAVSEIYAVGGIASLRSFVQSVETPWSVGHSLGAVGAKEIDGEILPNDLQSKTKSIVQFAGAFIRSRFHTFGINWARSIISKSWTQEILGHFMANLPFDPDTWDLAKEILRENEGLYWSNANVHPYEPKSDLERGIRKLVEFGRPNAALDCLYAMTTNKQSIDSKLAVKALLGSLTTKEPINSMDAYQTVQVIKALQENDKTDPKDLFQVEWAYVALLNEHNEAEPKLLEQELADRPEFFCEVVRLVFRSQNDAKDETKEPDERKQSIATNAYRLLDNWSKPPGSKADGSFDAAAFEQWVDAVKSATKESGHFEVAMTMVGHVLTYAPADPSGLWIHEVIAETLNGIDVQDMRDGFRTATFNSRGVFYFTSGEAERGLSETYAIQADALDSKGLSRFATTLRELSDSYKRHSEKDANRDPYFDE
jgi:hypothetical protein